MTESRTCPKCGSTEIMPEVRIFARRPGNLKHDLQVQVFERPDALIFKEAHFGVLKARVCGRCGSVELYASNPQGLWAAHQKGQKIGDSPGSGGR